MAEEIRSIRTRANQKEHNDVTKEVSNSQLQKETLIEDGQGKEEAEEPKYSDRCVEINRTKQSNFNVKKTENYNIEKEQQDIKSENCMKCDKYVETGVQCGYCQRWFHFKYEGTTKEKVIQEYPEEMQYIYKTDKVNQEERIWESKYKTTVIELEGLKDRYKEMEKEKKGLERKYASIKEVYKQTKLLSEQTKTKLKHLHQENERSEEVIKALRSMTKTKTDSVPDGELQIKQLQTSLEKEKTLVQRMEEGNF